MKLTHSIPDTRACINAARMAGMRIGFVPTMGALHAGHLSLVEAIRRHCDFVVMSIFVNPSQFNDPSDFDKYPRMLESDLDGACAVGVDLVFAPDAAEMYHNPLTKVEMSYLTETLCGEFRPGHFSGVCTVVSKLFNIIQPDCAVFGQKDIQQVSVIMKMVNDLDFPIQIIVAPIVREEDGLAMSSRNVRLDHSERKTATSIFQSLLAADNMLAEGIADPLKIEQQCRSVLHQAGIEKIDYVSLVDLATLHPLDTIDRNCVLAIACHVGNVRLIDNMIIQSNGGTFQCVY